MSLFHKDPEAEHRKRLRNILNKTIHQNCPAGWELQQFALGGLTEVGFSQQNPDLLLVLSGNGRGLFDCSTLEKIHRDGEEDFEVDYFNLTCPGIGALEQEQIRIAGLHGGGLPLGNSHGDTLTLMALDWPWMDVIFQPHWTSVYQEKDTEKCYQIYSSDSVKVYGFSPDGKTFVIGTSSDLLIYRKKN